MLSESLEKPCRLWITLEERLAEGKEFARGGCLNDRFGVELVVLPVVCLVRERDESACAPSHPFALSLSIEEKTSGSLEQIVLRVLKSGQSWPIRPRSCAS